MAGKVCSSSFKKDVFLEVAHFVENLDASAFPVTYVEETVARESYAVYNREKHAAHACFAFGLCGLATKWANVCAIAIENYNAAVSIAVSDVHLAVGRINRKARRPVEQRMT